MNKSIPKTIQICKKTTTTSITMIKSSIMKKKLKEGMIELQYSKNCKNSWINLKLKYFKMAEIKKFWALLTDKIQNHNLHKDWQTK